MTTQQQIQQHPKQQKQRPSCLRRGKWTMEEEAYVIRMIRDFQLGYLKSTPSTGTTLRTYLSQQLHCDPMRITKKFTGQACIGKRVFHPITMTTQPSQQSSSLHSLHCKSPKQQPMPHVQETMKKAQVCFCFFLVFVFDSFFYSETHKKNILVLRWVFGFFVYSLSFSVVCVCVSPSSHPISFCFFSLWSHTSIPPPPHLSFSFFLSLSLFLFFSFSFSYIYIYILLYRKNWKN